jgi:hypothetical protein
MELSRVNKDKKMLSRVKLTCVLPSENTLIK